MKASLRKLLATSLAFVLVASLLPVSALAYAESPAPGAAAEGGAQIQDGDDGECPSLAAASSSDLQSSGMQEMNAQALSPLSSNSVHVAQVALGLRHSAAVTSDGALWMWGQNNEGQLGIGDTEDRHTPVKVMDGVSSVSLGSHHSLALRADGTLWAWGRNIHGQVGNNSGTNYYYLPVKIMDDVSSISAGLLHSAAVKSDGTLWMWGSTTFCELGQDIRDNVSYIGCPRPVKIMDDVSSASLGYSVSAVIKKDGSLWAWGANSSGQLGIGSKTFQDCGEPVKVMDSVISVSFGLTHAAAVKEDGSLWTWGENSAGQLGDGTTQEHLLPTKVMDGVSLRSLDLSNCRSAIVKEDGSLWTWGWNSNGALGDGTTVRRLTPVKIMENAVSVSANFDDGNRISAYCAAIKADGSLWTWGGNDHGQLGDGTTTDRHSPVQITLGSGTPFEPDQPSALDPFTQEHIDFVNSDTYAEQMKSGWAKIISTGLDTTTGRIGEGLCDVFNDVDSLISGNVSKVSVFDNPYDPIVADLILAQSKQKKADFDFRFKKALTDSVGGLEEICQVVDKDSWNIEEYKTCLERLMESPEEYAKENPAFYKLCQSTFEKAASHPQFKSLVNAFGKADDLVGALDVGASTVEWVAYCLQYNALVDAYLKTSDEFKRSLKDAITYMGLNANGDNFLSRTQYGTLYEDACKKFAQFQTEDRVKELLFKEYVSNGLTRIEDVFGETVVENTVSYVAVGLGISKAAASWVFSAIAAYKAGWGISEAITDNGTNMDCRKLARAYYYLEDAMLWEVEDDASNLKSERTYEKAAKFDASYTMLQDLECGVLDNYITYLNAQQCSLLQGVLHGFRKFNEPEVCIAKAMKTDWETTCCHGGSVSPAADTSYGVIKVCCPTDVFVYDGSSNVVLSIEGGKVTSRTEGIDGYSAGGTKMLVIPNPADYRIGVVATDGGLMSYQASTYDSAGSLTNTAVYKDVELASGDTFTGHVDEDNIDLSRDDVALEQTSGDGDFVSVESVELSQSSVSLEVGDKSAVVATVLPVDASLPEVVWSTSDEGVATVDEDGNITGCSEGTCTVQCTALDSSQKYASVTVTVSKSSTPSGNDNPATSLEIDKSELSIKVGEQASLALTAKGALEGAVDDIGAVEWTSSDAGVAAVAGDGLTAAVDGLAPGRSTVTAKATVNGVELSASCTVDVAAIAVESVSLDKAEVGLVGRDSVQLSATVSPDNAANKNVSWSSSDEHVATVDGNGNVTSVGKGTATITATTEDGGKTATCQVTVSNPATSIALDKTELSVKRGKQVSLALATRGELEGPVDDIGSVEWTSSDSEVAAVSGSGLSAIANGIKAGTATITAKATVNGAGLSAICGIDVTGIAVESVALSEASKTVLLSDGPFQLRAVVLPVDADNSAVAWSSSNSTVASVDATGLVTPVSAGTTTISASAGGILTSCELTVTDNAEALVSAEFVELSETKLVLVGTQTHLLKAIVYPENASNKDVSWASSDVSVATVSDTGLVTSVGKGTATITATTKDGAKTSSCEVTVEEQPPAIIPVSGVSLDPAELKLSGVGVTGSIKATVLPDNATDKSVSWVSSDPAVATVDENGAVTSVSAGEATITASAGGHFAQCKVVVELPAPDGSFAIDGAAVEQGFSAAMPGGTSGREIRVVAEPVSSGIEYAAILARIADDSRDFASAFDVTLSIDGVLVDEGFGSLSLTFPVGEKYNGRNAIVYHCHRSDRSNIIEYDSVIVKDGKVTIEGVDKLSTFGIGVEKEWAQMPDATDAPTNPNPAGPGTQPSESGEGQPQQQGMQPDGQTDAQADMRQNAPQYTKQAELEPAPKAVSGSPLAQTGDGLLWAIIPCVVAAAAGVALVVLSVRKRRQ